ncbi:radical SAM protein [Terrimonas sp.]|uniref:radical SAM protein n=1 Tax=Terrimonas sp. TaxID=1914338 RepID=UPI0026D1229E
MMFQKSDYIIRGYNFLHNRLFPRRKKLSSLMIYATDVCDSGCKHCLIWAKRPTQYLPFERIVSLMKSKCINSNTSVGLEGGEFLLHPEAFKILDWFSRNHKNFDIFSNCLKPDTLIKAVQDFKPKRLYISLDGDEETYLYMRGKDGHNSVIKVIETLKDTVPIFVMFTLSPYNDFEDLKYVAELCKKYNVFLRVGIYNNIPFFDTIDDAVSSVFGQLKNKELLTFRKAKALQQHKDEMAVKEKMQIKNPAAAIPLVVKEFAENYDYIKLYDKWVQGKLRLGCNSILDSAIVLPDGSVPICQHLSLKLGNIYNADLDSIFNSEQNTHTQLYHSKHCNQCWVSYHRKYDVILYRTFEKYFGRRATSKMLGYYKWDSDDKLKYNNVVK